MSDHRLDLPFWEGFLVASLETLDGTALVRLIADPACARRCSHCGSTATGVHETSWRIVRDMPIAGHSVRLELGLPRLHCITCGRRCTQRVTWLDRHARVTRRLADFVAHWSEKLPITHVCELTGLHWGTVRQIHRQDLERRLAALPTPEPKRLVMDEFALFKGHRYATVVLDADTRRVLWVGEGRSRDAVRPFFEWLGPQRCRAIQAVAMDMNTAFDLEVQRHCPQARVVYDLFHVIAKYGREVIDRVRVDEANRLRDQRGLRQIVKRARWLLLRNRENVPADQQPKLDELLAANQGLMTVYVMKASLKELWQIENAWQWRAAWRNWLEMANGSGIEPLKRFARRLASYWRGILARVRWTMHTGQLEGINNRIKVMKRMAYGYRDSEFF
ncbi:ISL3 family transposase, partial [Massilia sp. TS11]|uniref:ISL3 family transposase n=1 Tax=Massilia sp. TS11 TaxID=2908003 RepID=UPI001EDB88AF